MRAHPNAGSYAFLRSFTLAALAGLVVLPTAEAQVSYGAVDSIYAQNFDSLPNTPENATLGSTTAGWVDDTSSPGANQFSILGWYLLHPLTLTEGGASGNQRVRIGAGTANTGAFMSYGASGSTDRALGSLPSNALTPAGSEVYFGLRLRNATGVTLESFTLSYTGEQWRDGGSATPAAQTLTFGWSTSATGLTNGIFTAEANLSYNSPIFLNTGAGAAVNGNTTGAVSVVGYTVNGINWQPDTDLWLRWSDVNNAGNDHGLAIDDLQFAATVPEPSTWALLALGAAALFGLRGRKR
jgi:hypothetical protein